MPMHRPSVVSSRISRVRVRMTASISRSSPKWAKSSTPPSARTTQRMEKNAFSSESSSVPASRGTESSMGATMMSWNTRIARERRPVGVLVVPRSCRIRSTMAEEERATRQPQKMPF